MEQNDLIPPPHSFGVYQQSKALSSLMILFFFLAPLHIPFRFYFLLSSFSFSLLIILLSYRYPFHHITLHLFLFYDRVIAVPFFLLYYCSIIFFFSYSLLINNKKNICLNLYVRMLCSDVIYVCICGYCLFILYNL